MKKTLKVIIPLVIVVAVAGAGIFAVRSVGGRPSVAVVNTYRVTKGDLENYVSVTGLVESGNSVNVYTSLTYPVEEVLVEVGDTVKEGDVLCKLDTAALEYTIAQNQAALGKAQAQANHSLAVAEKDLETVQFNVERDYNSELLKADSTVQSAEAAVNNAEAAVKSAENTLEKGHHDLSEWRRVLREYQEDDYVYDSDTVDTKLAELKSNVTSAEIALESYKLQVEKAELQLAQAKKDLAAAKTSQKATQMQVQESEISTQDQVENAKLGTDFSDQYIALQKLQKDLSDATIKAPVSGTVTAVYAKEGITGSLLFVLEDTDDLKVVTKIKEYDVGTVSVGMPVSIKADATGDDQYEGELTLLSPTSVKDATGNTLDTTSSEFPAEVTVTPGSRLRIGMNARLNIITEQKSGVLSVPTDAVASDEDGGDVVFVAEAQEDGTFVARKIKVTVGMETDFACEISGEGLSEGVEVVLDPSGVTDGMQVIKPDAGQDGMQQALNA